MAHICVTGLIIIGWDNGFSPGQCQGIIWTSAGILLIGTLGTNLSEILIEIHTFSFKKMHIKISSAKWWPFCLSLNVLRKHVIVIYNYHRYSHITYTVTLMFCGWFSLKMTSYQYRKSSVGNKKILQPSWYWIRAQVWYIQDQHLKS